MQVRYNPQVAQFFIVIGGLNLLFGIITSLTGRFNAGVITGLLFVVMGVMLRDRLYFSIDRQQVTLAAMIGPIKRTLPIASPADVKLEDNKLYVKKQDKWQNIGVAKWLSHKDDWYNLEVFVQQLTTVT